MRARGLSQTQIARELQVSNASISSDMQYLRNQAEETIREYVTALNNTRYVSQHCRFISLVHNLFFQMAVPEDEYSLL
jgi:predicted transcriptional regulator